MMIALSALNKRQKRAVSLSLMLCLAMVTACAGPQVIVPGITPNPTGTYHVGTFVWFDLLTNDVPGTKRFYGELFNWEFEAEPSDDSFYATIKKNGTPIGSAIYLKRTDIKVSESRWLSYLSVPDVDRAADHARHGGGVVLKEPWDFPDRGRIAIVRDPQGAMLALIRAKNGDPPDVDLAVGKWMWNELWTTDVDAAITFYKTLVGLKHETIDLSMGDTYHQLKQAGRTRAGVVPIPWEDVNPNWLPYVAVSDISATIALAKTLGGTVVIEPDDTISDDSVAVIVDPSGAALAIQNLPLDEGVKEDPK
jgi:predicted enzyme related to lactoylglutathione lyase